VLVDPSWELKTDADAVLRMLRHAHRRFDGGVFAIWYPVVERARCERFCRGIRETGIRDVLRFELCVAADSDERGMTGSGMVVVNPPFTLEARMREALPWLEATLGEGRGRWLAQRLAEE
jgi:23S rRNA (adenine2030-N6)-methyltransferase